MPMPLAIEAAVPRMSILLPIRSGPILTLTRFPPGTSLLTVPTGNLVARASTWLLFGNMVARSEDADAGLTAQPVDVLLDPALGDERNRARRIDQEEGGDGTDTVVVTHRES